MEMPWTTDRLRAVLAVARDGGFSRAARRLGVTQSSLSQAVARLEEALGEQLFVRDGRRSFPTEAGRLVVEHGERAFAELDRARAAIAALSAVAAGTLRLGTSDTLATYLLPPVFAALRSRHPGVDLVLANLPSPAVAAQVADGALDVGVVSLPLPASLRSAGRAVVPRLAVTTLRPAPDVVILPPAHPLAKRRALDLADLAATPLVLLDRSTASRAVLDARFQARGLAPRVAMETTSVEVGKRLVALGFGVSVVPALAVERELAEGSLVTRPVRGLGPSRAVGLLLPGVGTPTHAASTFAALTRELLPAPSPAPRKR